LAAGIPNLANGAIGNIVTRSETKRSGTQEAGATGLEPAASGVTGRRSNQLNYAPAQGIMEFIKRGWAFLT
jgi:hypothetical protein